MIVSNTSPIILFAKQGRLSLLKDCFGEVMVPQAVYDEISRKNGSFEAAALERAIRENWMLMEKTTILPSLETKNLGEGEKEAISLASRRECVLLIDDDSAKAYSRMLGVNAHGSLYALFIAFRKRVISQEEAITMLKVMEKDGLYLSHEVHLRFLDLLNDK